MVKGVLVERVERAGRKLVELLDAEGWETKAALWLYRPEKDRWVLMLASPEVERSGPRPGYEKVHAVLRSHQDDLSPLTLEDIVVTGCNDPLVRELRTAVQTGPGITEIRFTENRAGNTFIEDALIYRMQ